MLYLLQLHKPLLNPWRGLVSIRLALVKPFLSVGLREQEEEEAMVKARYSTQGLTRREENYPIPVPPFAPLSVPPLAEPN